MFRPPVLVEDYEAGLEDRGIDEKIDLTITDDSGDGCLGLCTPSNVALLILKGRSLWFGRMNTKRTVRLLMEYLAEVVDDDDPPLPQGELAKYAFTRMRGEMMPIEDVLKPGRDTRVRRPPGTLIPPP